MLLTDPAGLYAVDQLRAQRPELPMVQTRGAHMVRLILASGAKFTAKEIIERFNNDIYWDARLSPSERVPLRKKTVLAHIDVAVCYINASALPHRIKYVSERKRPYYLIEFVPWKRPAESGTVRPPTEVNILSIEDIIF